jgi:glyoxylase-like metal-dependent hydrolase (beta-lactamase superfamily II)
MRSKSLTRLVPVAFLLVAGFGTWRSLEAAPPAAPSPALQQARIVDVAKKQPPVQNGQMPPTGWWIDGTDCAGEPQIQVWKYNQDTYLLRQSKCDTFEAPFMYLLFGEDRALLMDTGAYAPSPVRFEVNKIVRDWLQAKGRTEIPLVVAHTHHHFDHVQSDGQFPSLSYLETLVAPNGIALQSYWGFSDYPNDEGLTYDLGGRVLDVLGTPGHHPDTVTLYDRNTQLLFTNDIVYPGHLFVFSGAAWFDFISSIQRLVDFAATHPVKWLVGCHIETSTTPGVPYAYTTLEQPNEVALQLKPSMLVDVLSASLGMMGDPQCTIFDYFVIHPVYLCGITWNG